MRRERMDIVACTDSWFVMPTAVMIYSVCVNNPNVDIVFHVIVDADVTPKNKRDLEKEVFPFEGKTISFYDSTLLMQSFEFPPVMISKGITRTTYYRLFIAELLPPDIEKVLYLDVDIIVRHSLRPLWKTDISNYAVAAAPDIFSDITEFYERLKISRRYCYVNAGVLLINLEYWRECSMATLFLTWISENENVIHYGDQDVLNAVLKEKILLIPQKYNLMHGFLWKQSYYLEKFKNDIAEAKQDPTIVHFSGEKPWDVYNLDPRHPFVSTFIKYQRQTKWKGMRIDKRPLRLKIINFLSDMQRELGLKPPRNTFFEYIDIAPID